MLVKPRSLLKHKTYIGIAQALASLSTCTKRQVGCVILDHRGRIAATGYNGQSPNEPHCIDSPCAGAAMPNGQGFGQMCEATHAEMSAYGDCSDIWDAETLYVTIAPCTRCLNSLKVSGISTIIYLNEHHHAEESKRRWESTTAPDHRPRNMYKLSELESND